MAGDREGAKVIRPPISKTETDSSSASLQCVRMAAPAPAPSAALSAFDEAALADNIRTLASAPFGGRFPNSEGRR